MGNRRPDRYAAEMTTRDRSPQSLPTPRAGRNKPRVQFIHGLEGSPKGAKARQIADAFDAVTPAMETSNFEASVDAQSAALHDFRPDVLVGSSFGGAVAVALLRRELWRGPTLLLAQAALHYDPRARLPGDVTVWLVHGTRDDLIDAGQSRRLASTGNPDRVRLLEVDDDHALHASVERGDLTVWIADLFDFERTRTLAAHSA